jgi:DNA polymerase-3 subunit delta
MASVLNPLRLESVLEQQGPGPLYLIVGEEDLLRDRALAVLKAAVLGTEGEFNYDLFYGDETGASDIRNCTSEMPVFAERRLVVVKAADKLSAAEGATLLDYLKDPVMTTTLAFVSPKLDGRLKWSQALAQTAVTVDCAPLRDAQVLAWLTDEAGRMGLRLEGEAAQLLRESSGGSLYGVQRELEKLASYVSPDRAATAADVLALRGMEPGASVFDLTLAIAEGHRGRTLAILARNLDAGEAPLRILGSLAWQYRRLWKVKELLANGGREGEAARTLRMDPLKVRSFVARFSLEHLQAALRLFLDADGKLKGAGSGRPRMVLERVLLRLCELSTRPIQTPPQRPFSSAGRVSPRAVSNVRTIKKGSRIGR